MKKFLLRKALLKKFLLKKAFIEEVFNEKSFNEESFIEESFVDRICTYIECVIYCLLFTKNAFHLLLLFCHKLVLPSNVVEKPLLRIKRLVN